MKVLVCSRCNGVNPLGAQYCHRDGLALDHAAGPVDAGSRPFLTPFVFPSGHTCKTFDELVLAAEEHWEEAQELLRLNTLGIFLAGIGRADLARLAAHARSAPDPDLALDDFLRRLPSDARPPPSLHVQPQEINLGQVARLETRRLMLRLLNEGMGLLHGSISSDAPWLMLGEEPGVSDKHFECRRDLSLVVQVIGPRLRASTKPLVGKLLVESSGGTLEVTVRAEVPVEPFTQGVLAGAASPRQLAAKARAAPLQVGSLFESGAVRRWYEDNGWDYPIQGAQAAGLGAVQQFFEALGLTVPPKVEISDTTVELAGNPGETLLHTLRVTTAENRPVYAHAVSEAPWLTIGKISGRGKLAKVRLLVESVPPRPGETLLGQVRVHANGGQSFLVAVSLRVNGTPPVLLETRAAPAESVNGAPILDPCLVKVLDAPPLPNGEEGPRLAEDSSDDFAALLDLPPVPVRGEGRGARGEKRKERDDSSSLTPHPSPLTPLRGWPHLVGPAIIVLVLLIALWHDALLPSREEPSPGPPPGEPADPNPHLALRIHDGPKQNRLEYMPQPTMRFGLVLPRDENPSEPGRLKRLTFDEWGRSNNTCLRVDGTEVLFGEAPGAWVERYRPRGNDVDGFDSVWRTGRLEVTQRVEIVPGRQSRLLDTCLIRYALVNRDPDLRGAPLVVGLRFLLDTYIGSLDGVPWTLPGQRELCETQHAFDVPGLMPDFLEALERNDLKSPGAVARVSLRLGRQIEPPSRVRLGAWPSRELQQFGHKKALAEKTLWEVPHLPMRELHDCVRDRFGQQQAAQVDLNSAVTLYWDEKELAPGARREVGFAYGLGHTAGDASGRLLLSLGGRFVPGGEITLVALVHKLDSGDTLTLKLPEGFDLLPGFRPQQPVPAVAATAERPQAPVTWRFRAGPAGTHTLRIQSSSGTSADVSLRIHAPGKGGTSDVFD
jgi:hypothetical protein